MDGWKRSLAPLRKYDKSISRVDELLDKIQDQTTNVVILGEIKAGKSTFINALLGEELVQSGTIPTTAVATKITYGPRFRIIAKKKDGTSTEVNRTDFIELSTEVEGSLKADRLNLDYIEIETPNDILKGITVIDTPGYNSGIDHHTEAADAHSTRGDYAIWVFDARHTGQETEKLKIKEIKSKKQDLPIYGVINKIDIHDYDEEPLESFLEANHRTLNELVESLTPVSSKLALEAFKSDDNKKLGLSMWENVEEIFSTFRMTDEEKNERLFAAFADILSNISDLYATEMKRAPVHFYAHFMNQVLHEQMPSLQSEYIAFDNHMKTLESEVLVLHQLLTTPLESHEAIQNHNHLLKQLKNRYPFVQIPAFNWLLFQDLERQFGSMNRSFHELKEQREAISNKWSQYSNVFLFRKSKLEKLLDSQEAYNRKLTRNTKEMDNLKREERTMEQLLHRYFEDLNQELLKVYEHLLHEMMALASQWNEKWEQQMRNFSKLPDEKLELLAELQGMFASYSNTIGPFFQKDYREIEPLGNYQQAKYKNEMIIGMLPELPVSSYKECKEAIRWMEHLSSHETEDIKGASFDYQHLLQQPTIYVPEKLTLPIEAEIQKIIGIRKKSAVALGVVCLLIVLLNVDIPKLFDRESIMAEPLRSDAEYEYETYSDSLATGESEALDSDFTDWNEQDMSNSQAIQQPIQINESNLVMFMLNYRESYMEALNDNMFELVAPYLLEGSTAYREIDDYIYDVSPSGAYFDFTSTVVDELEQKGISSYLVRTTEVFVFEDRTGYKERFVKKKEYTVELQSETEFKIKFIKTLDTQKEKIIEKTVSEVTRDDLMGFVIDFFNEYVNAMNIRNSDDLSPYLAYKGGVKQEIEKYIDEANPEHETVLSQLAIETIDVHDDQHYRVNVYVHLDHNLYGELISAEKYNQQLLIHVGPYGQLQITEIMWTAIIEGEDEDDDLIVE
nr:dynamin family protein [Sporosarcina sp. ACRSM]